MPDPGVALYLILQDLMYRKNIFNGRCYSLDGLFFELQIATQAFNACTRTYFIKAECEILLH